MLDSYLGRGAAAASLWPCPSPGWWSWHLESPLVLGL